MESTNFIKIDNGNNWAKLFNDDCFNVFPYIKDNSIDMILCDLPYGTTSCSWDTVIPFEPLWEQYKRIIKDDGAIVLTASQPFTSALVMSNPKMFKYEWVWEKEQGVGFQLAKYRPLLKNESCLVFSKKTPKYIPQKELLDKPKTIKRKANSNGKSESSPIKYAEERTSIYTHKTPDNFLKFRRDKGFHPTQKPVALFEYLIKTYTEENYLVLDNCMGSGTTGVACKNLNRNFIGIEKEIEYYDIAVNRIKGDL